MNKTIGDRIIGFSGINGILLMLSALIYGFALIIIDKNMMGILVIIMGVYIAVGISMLIEGFGVLVSRAISVDEQLKGTADPAAPQERPMKKETAVQRSRGSQPSRRLEVSNQQRDALPKPGQITCQICGYIQGEGKRRCMNCKNKLM